MCGLPSFMQQGMPVCGLCQGPSCAASPHSGRVVTGGRGAGEQEMLRLRESGALTAEMLGVSMQVRCAMQSSGSRGGRGVSMQVWGGWMRE